MPKFACDVLVVPLTLLINTAIQEGQVPKTWKEGRVLPLHKKKDKSCVKNYRPVTILPSPSKIFEEVVRKQLSSYVERKGILPDTQYGFREGLSTVHAVAAADHDWRRARRQGLSCGTMLFDLTAAFDTLDPELLVAKLAAYGADKKFQRLIMSFMTERYQRVDFGGASSERKQLAAGSPQGSVLSPLLFLVMVADLGEWVSEARVMSYADDTNTQACAATKSEVRGKLERAAEEVLTFMSASKLSANPEKTKFVLFGRKHEEPLKVGGAIINESKEECLLGLTFSKSLSWKKHVDLLCSDLMKRVGVISRLHFHLPTVVLVSLIEPLFTSKLRYGLELLVDIEEGHQGVNVRRIENIQKKAMQAALGWKNSKGMSIEELRNKTLQPSVFEMALIATCNQAWKCGQDWEKHPLTKGRLRSHMSMQSTRQYTQRQYPPQQLPGSLVHRMVELWEIMPTDIKEEKNLVVAKKKIKAWSRATSTRDIFDIK